jgi:hypothetical protein
VRPRPGGRGGRWFLPTIFAAAAIAAANLTIWLDARVDAPVGVRPGLVSGPGSSLIIAYPHSAAAKVEPAVTRAITKAVGEAEGHHVKALKGAIADAQQKMADTGT